MKKMLCAVLSAAMLFALTGCGTDRPSRPDAPDATDTQDNNTVTTPSDSSDGVVNPTDSTPSSQPGTTTLTPEQIELVHAQDEASLYADAIARFYDVDDIPVLYPPTELMLEWFQSLVIEESVGRLIVSFDKYSVGITDYGYSVEISEPLDQWGNRYRVWFEAKPADTSICRISFACAGPDGEMVFDGVGHTYDKGFGDDIVIFKDVTV